MVCLVLLFYFCGWVVFFVGDDVVSVFWLVLIVCGLWWVWGCVMVVRRRLLCCCFCVG